jgi:hypothetical protein
MNNQVVELISAEDKLKIREFQLTILQNANLCMNLEKKFNEAAAMQQKAQAELSKLIEEIKPKEGKWDLQDNLTLKKIEEPVPVELEPKVE